MMKILILRFSSIGDIVLTTPVLRALKLQLPDAVIHYCTKPAYASILEANPYVSKVKVLEKKLWPLIQQLKAENYDYIIDLHNNLRTQIIKWLVAGKPFSFQKLNFQKWLLVNFKIDLLPEVHIVDRYMDTVKWLDVANDEKGLDYFIPSEDEVLLSTLPSEFQKGFVGFAIGAQHFTKRLPKEKIAEFCHQISEPILLLGGKEDVNMGQWVEEAFLKHPYKYVLNVCGSYNLNQSASLVRQSKWMVTHDTGLMHIAAAFKKEVVSVWGNTIPRFGMYPYATSFRVIENNALYCRPCSKIGYGKCPQGHFKCMMDLEFEGLGS